jgi:hypothetical protein
MTPHENRDRRAVLDVAESMSVEAVGAMEERLLQAFAEHHARTPRRAAGQSRGWVAAAALVLLTAGGAAAWTVLHRGAAPQMVAVSGRQPSAAPQGTVPPAPPADAGGTAAGTPAGGVRAPHSRSVRRASRPASPAFVALPGAADLPRFESGSIVRIDLPLASLAAYGVDISGASRTGPVATDVLVGQDGEPRAIRLVPTSFTSSNSRSRQ